jgi:molybdopterin synthase catalytic subunit
MRLDIKVNADVIDLGLLPWAECDLPSCGASNLFSGMVRNRNHGRDVEAVAYDAFELLAEKVLMDISETALREVGGVGSVYIRHRTGTLKVGEVSVVILVHTPHRDQAFQACRSIIEELKLKAPIWKKEYYTDGETEWLKGHALCGHDHRQGVNHA